MMIRILKTDSNNEHFQYLVRFLDQDLADRDGEEHSFYDQFNKIDQLQYCLVAYLDQQPVGCGALKYFKSGVMEIKRMYTIPEQRGNGFASSILSALENWAAELNFDKCILETGKKQPEAIQLYFKRGYTLIPNYGPYVGITNSLCFEKAIR